MKDDCRGKLDSSAHRLVDKYIRVTRLQKYVMERQLGDTGVYRSQHQILMSVADNPNASQKDIAKYYGVSTATVAVTLKKLERGGYVQKIVDQKDNRFNQICLTEKGRKVVSDSFNIFQSMENRMFEGFSEENFNVMGELFDKMYENLKNELPARTESEDS